MTYKSLVACVHDSDYGTRILDTANTLATHFDAHLTGAFVHEPFHYQYPLSYIDPAPDFSDEIRRSEQQAEAARAVFEKLSKASDWLRMDWRFIEGETLAMLQLQARYADVVIMEQADMAYAADRRPRNPDLPADLAIASGRPVLVVPYDGEFETLGKRILIAWNASREATRAVREALPLLRDAERVVVLCIDAKTDRYLGHGEDPGADIALYLSRHGVNVEVKQVTSDDKSIADTLISEADAMDADLVCMGAYGHSRLREMVLGGATRQMLQDMSIPVLLAH